MSYAVTSTVAFNPSKPCTAAVYRALQDIGDDASAADQLFLERWELSPIHGAASALRVAQIRRANPELAAEIRAELRVGRPLTQDERARLLAPSKETGIV